MTIATAVRTAGPYTGTGLVSVYPFAFKVFQSSDLLVTSTNTAGNISTLVLSSDYSVTLNADQDTAPGGTINLVAALASGYALSIASNVPATQPVALTNGGGFFPKVIEAALDRLTILLQQTGLLGVVQSLRVPEIGGVPTLPAAAARANRIHAYDSSGNPVMIVGVDSGSAAALALDLANNTLAAKGAGQVAYAPVVGYPAGSVGAAIGLNAASVMVQKRFEGTNTDDAGTPDATFRVNRTLSAGVLDGHGFRDQTTFSRTANSYAAFDAAITSSGSGTNDHIAGFQARPVVSRSGGSLIHVYNFVSAPTFNSGNATNNYGLFCFNPVGAGTVDYNYGLYIPQQSKGSISNHAIYVAQGGHQVFLGADTQINQLLRVGTAQLILGALTTSDYPYVGYNYEPTTGKYQASDIAVTTKFDPSGFRVFTAASGTAGAACTLTQRLQVSMAGDVVQNVNTSAPALGTNGQMVFALTSNTNLRVSVRGSDGVTRVANLTLA